jgi:hypothetical protein
MICGAVVMRACFTTLKDAPNAHHQLEAWMPEPPLLGGTT